MEDSFKLNRFIEAQDHFENYNRALEEVRNSKKEGHWIWYIFPQMAGLGHSHNSNYYGIKSLLEAKAYLEEETLRKRLYEITNALYNQDCSDPESIFGGIDAMKVCSCMTLFEIVSPSDIFTSVLEYMYGGEKCERTLALVKKELDYYKSKSPFKRNGIVSYQDRGFFESGICESDKMNEDNVVATFVDLMRRGETMKEMVSHYLWRKDFSYYRISNIESTLRSHLFLFIHELIESTTNEDLKISLFKDQKIANEYTNDVFTVAKNWDAFFCKISNDERLIDAINKISIKSLANK
ncbi:MAG: DUF1810 domain-containing protein [Paludibacteraceae bacterium]|jgi:uncharacterized protein (DUF1810 family)|nr:DUF1810 domain-containing protein [Paludibacteraceae bacterium]MEE1176704.1 DUF1810 domain-containing protein [Paludibacteraceae bacterium]MEE1260907.1 DUF1810 domain-containing protein [Paludibacteraceae bacterium]